MNRDRVPVAFRARVEPLAPVAVAARGDAARALARRLLARDEAALAQLRGVAGPDLLVLLGDAALLPWVDGVSYLGRDPRAPSLLLPSALEPDAPCALLERALLAHAGAHALAPPLAVLADPPALASVADARPIARARLAAWLEGGA